MIATAYKVAAASDLSCSNFNPRNMSFCAEGRGGVEGAACFRFQLALSDPEFLKS